VYKIIHLAVFVGADLCLRVRPDSALLGRQTAEWSELAIFIGQNALKAEMAENDSAAERRSRGALWPSFALARIQAVQPSALSLGLTLRVRSQRSRSGMQQR
jgi:hypothetical protein